MSRRRWLVLALAGIAALAVAGFVAARALDVRDLLGLRSVSSAPPLIDSCRSAQDVVLPFGSESASGRWRALPPSPIAQDEPRAAAVGHVVYIAGGLEQRRPGGPLTSIGTFVAYDAKTRTYERLPRLPTRVDHPAFVAVDDSVYLIGGYHDGIPLDTLLRYTPGTRRVDGARTHADRSRFPHGRGRRESHLRRGRRDGAHRLQLRNPRPALRGVGDL